MRIVVAGASRGLGAALAEAFEARGDAVIGLSRSEAAAGRWVKADLSTATGAAEAAAAIGPAPVDALVHSAGIWEAAAFTPEYDFAASPPAEIQAVIATNLLGPILLAQALLPQLTSARGRVVWIGSTSGLSGIGTPEVAYNASKAGLIGAGEALRVALRDSGIGVSVLNPGDFAETADPDAPGIPQADLIRAVFFAVDAGPMAEIASIDIWPRGQRP